MRSTDTINWAVTGNELAKNVTITDTVPLNTEFDNCGTCIFNGDTVQWNLGDHNPGDAGTVFFQVQVNSPLTNATVITNSAYIFDTNSGIAVDDTVINTVNSNHTLNVTKSAGPNPVNAGGQLVYTINWAVNGNEPAPNVVISDTIPANTSYVAASCTGGCTKQGNDLVWNLGNKNPGTSGIVQFTVAVTDVLANGSSIENTVIISDDDPGTAADSDTIQTAVKSGHVLSVVKGDSPDPVNAGQSLTYTIDWTLTGNESSQNLRIVDILPDGVALNLAATTPAPTTVNDQTLTWDLGDRTPADSGTITVVVTVTNVLPNGTILSNQVNIADSNSGVADSDFEQTTVNSGHSLTIVKDGPATVNAGGQINYTISYTVTGNEIANNVIIEDLVPANTTFVSASGATNIDKPPFGSGGQVRWYLGNLSPGTTSTVLLTVRTVTPLNNGTVIENEAAIRDNNGGVTDSDNAVTTVQSSHGFLLTKHDNVATTVAPNDIINYTIDWQVTGFETAQNVTITDTIPANTSFVFCSGDCVLLGNTVRWTLNNRNPNQSGTVFLQVRVATPLADGTIITNTARISDTNGGTPISSQTTTEVNSNHTLTLSKSGPGIVNAGAPIVYTINYGVTGNEPAPNVVITDTVPVSTSYTTCSGGLSCTQFGGVVTWTLGTLNPGAGGSGSVQLTVNVISPLPDETIITNIAHIFDNDDGAATDDAQTTVASGHSYSITKSDAGYDPVQAGQQIVYTIDWTLEGNEDATGVIIEDTLPGNTSFVGCEPAIQCGHSLGVVTWNLDNQVVGASGTVTVTVAVASPLDDGTLLSNFVEISDSNDGLPANDTEQTTVYSDHSLTVVKSGPETVAAGGQITYTIAYTVTGNETAKNVVIEDLTPVNTTFANAQGGQSINQPPVGTNGTIRWNLGNLPPGTSGVVTLTVNVNSPLNNGLFINNAANIADSNGGTTDNDNTTTMVQSAHAFILTKSDTPDPSVPNGVITYIIHWEVTGNERAQNLVITDAIPANTIYEFCGSCVPQAGYVQWNLGNRNPGESGDLTFLVRVNTPLVDGTIITNTARIFDTNGGTPVNAQSTTEINSDHTLSLSKSGPSIVSAGDPIVYTINYSVSGNEPAPNVVITDTVPLSTSYTTCSGGLPTCQQVGGVVTWTLGTLNPGANGSVQLTVNVASPLADGTIITNRAFIFDDDDGAATDDDQTTVSSGHGYSITKSDAGDPVQAGQQIVYTIDWTLEGNEDAEGVTIEDTLPGNTSFVGCEPAIQCDHSLGVVTWNLDDQPVGASGTVTVTVAVTSPLDNGTLLSNFVEISDSNDGLPASNTEQTTVNSSHVLIVDKNGPTTVEAGGQITYTIAYTVTGNETAKNVVIEDFTPLNTTFAGAQGGQSIDQPPVGNSGIVRWHLGNLPPGTSRVVTLTVNVNTPLNNGLIINNTANIADGNGGATDSDGAATTVESDHAFILTKSDTPDPSVPNGVINYTIHWEVTGNEIARNVVITDGIPANTAFESCSGCVPVPPAQVEYVQWNLGNQNPGSSGDLTFQVRVADPLVDGTIITNIARIYDTNGGTPVNAQTTTEIRSGHSLTLDKVAPGTVNAGGQIVYTINYAAFGNEPAPNVTITDTIPASTTYDVGAGCGGCTENNGILTWDLDTLNPDDSGFVQFTVNVDSPLPNGTPIRNTAFIFDTDNASGQDTTTTLVNSQHQFTIQKSDAADPVQAGNQIVYTINWGLSGNEVAENVVVEDVLPANTTFAGCSNDCTPNGNTVTWDLGTLTPPVNGTLQLTVTVKSPLPNNTLLTNQVNISDDNDGAAASDSEQTTVTSGHALEIAKSGLPNPVSAGGQITYTITYTVTGNEAAPDVVVEDVIPNNTTFASASAGYTFIGGLVRWNLGDLDPGEGGTLTLVVNVKSPLPNGTVIENTVFIRDDDDEQDSATEQTNTTGEHALSITKSDSPDPVRPEQIITYVLNWAVTGNESAQNVVITDAIPAGTSYWNCGSGCTEPLPGVIQWNLSSRNPGENGTVNLQVRVNPLVPNGTIITNTAYIFDSNNGAPAVASTTSTVESDHILTISKQAPATVQAGEQILYTIDYAVSGDETAPGVAITDAIPVGTSYIANSCTGGINCFEAGGIVTWAIGDQVPGDSDTVRFSVRVADATPNDTQIRNTAYIFDSDDGTATDDALTVVGSGGLSLLLTDNRETVQPGERITYTISFSGTEPLSAGTVGIDIPVNTILVSNSPGLIAGDSIIWFLPPQSSNFSGVRYMVVELLPVLDNGIQIETTAYIAGNGLNTQDSESATVVSSPNLTTSVKEVNSSKAKVGDLVTYRIVLTNSGNMHAYNTTITDVIPSGLVYTNAVVATSGTPSYSNGTVHWNDEVRVGTPVEIEFTARISDTVVPDETEITNIVQIDDGINEVLERSVTVSAVTSDGKIYLPIILSGSAGSTPTGDNIELIIRNCGDTNALGAFWVDLYINPDETSQFWPIGYGEGYDWFGKGAGFVVSQLGPGESRVLYLDDAVQSDLPNPLPASPKLYAQVDLFGDAANGVVDEGAETNNVASGSGSSCSATAGKPDLIVESIRRTSNITPLQTSQLSSAPVEGLKPVPLRSQPPR